MGMIAVKCPQCGADIQLDDSREFGFCNYCGTKIIQDRIIHEHKGSVKVDNSERINNLYQIARREKELFDIGAAAKHYGMILIECPNDWEAQFFTTYFESLSCSIAQISSAADKISKAATFALVFINRSDLSLIEKKKAVVEIALYVSKAGIMLYKNAEQYYIEHDWLEDNPYSMGKIDFYDRADKASKLISGVAFAIDLTFEEHSIAKVSVEPAKIAAKQTIEWLGYYHVESRYSQADWNTVLNNINSLIIKYEPNYEPQQAPEKWKPEPIKIESSNKSGGCYVATAIYGSYDCPEVWTLRRFRDYSLALTWCGRLFITLYYATSPTIVKWFGHTKWFNKLWRGKLDRIVDKLKSEGFEDTPYDDIKW